MGKELGYFKVYRTIDTHPLLSNDNNALVVLMRLLAKADYKTGSLVIGRNKFAREVNMKPSTLYSVLRRVELANMIQQQSNSSSTTILICNWEKWQQDDAQLMHNSRSRGNTIQEIRNKKKNIDTNVSMVTKSPSTEVDSMFDFWKETTGTEISGQIKNNRYACSNLLKKHGPDKLKQLITGVAMSRQDKFAPRIANFSQLQAKQDDLIVWGQKNKVNNARKVVKI